MTDAPYPQKTPFPPQVPCPFDRAGDEEHVHSLILRGYRYAPALTAPLHENYTAHLTTRRMVLIPLPLPTPDAALSSPEDAEVEPLAASAIIAPREPIAFAWNDIIEIRTAEGSRLPDTLPGAEDHMLLIEARSREAREFSEMLLFTVEPRSGALPGERPAHGVRFIERVEELLFDAFEA